MKVLVYVEGPSDKSAMESLLEPLLEKKQQDGVLVEFFQMPDRGDNKRDLLKRIPVKAINILLNTPDGVVVAMPDLYPRDKVFPHSTFRELQDGILGLFHGEIEKRPMARKRSGLLRDRFKVFCFKHDLESLVLAGEEALLRRLNAEKFQRNWRRPVEDQNHSEPPKGVVEDLFRASDQKYRATVDAHFMLGQCDYEEIAERCPQCFRPFVEFLKGLCQTP